MKKLLSIALVALALVAGFSYGNEGFFTDGRTRSGGGGGTLTLNNFCQRSNEDVVTSTSCSLTKTATNLIWCAVTYEASGGGRTMTVADGSADTYTSAAAASTYDDPYGQIQSFYVANATSGTVTVTATYSSTVRFPTLWCGSFSGPATSTPLVTGLSNIQTAPGTGSNAITTGNTGTLSVQPAFVLGICYDADWAATPSMGTGYTEMASGSPTWAPSGSNVARVGWKYVTSTAAVAFTCTTSAGSGKFKTSLGVFKE